jgi:hypothetical protein
MYLRITKSLLEGRPRRHLLQMFQVSPGSAKLRKKELVEHILSKITPTHKSRTLNPYLLACEYCGVSFTFSASGIPIYCSSCGKTSPYLAFERNLQRTQLLMAMASKSRKLEESESRAILLEQALVTTITSFEVLLREVYSLIVDHRHVIVGETIYPRIYNSTRNEFLGLGSANAKFKKDLGFNLKQKLGPANYSFLSNMFSARHIIVHNCSIKDTNYLSQTGEPAANLNTKLSVTVPELTRLGTIARKVAKLGEAKLRECILDHHRKQTDLIVTISDKRSPSNKSLNRSGISGLRIRRSRMLV